MKEMDYISSPLPCLHFHLVLYLGGGGILKIESKMQFVT
jgi:hypothetical protein